MLGTNALAGVADGPRGTDLCFSVVVHTFF
jgi:hypothetical protein